MAEGKILTRNVRFPKDNLPDLDFNPNKYPQWLQEIEVIYDDNTLVDGKGKYTIKRLHGPAAGDTETPVYMDINGQPQPITDLADSIVRSGNLAARFQEVEDKIAGAQVSVSENSPLLNIIETHGEDNVDYEIQESISDFLARNQDNVSIFDNFVMHEIPAVNEVDVPAHEEPVLVNGEVEPIYTYAGTALDYFNLGDQTYQLDSNIQYDPQQLVVIVSKLVNDEVVSQKLFYIDDEMLGMGSGYHPNAGVPEEGGTWGFVDSPNTLSAAVVMFPFSVDTTTNTMTVFTQLGLHWVGVHNDDDQITVSIQYSPTNRVDYYEMQEVPATYREAISAGVSVSLGEGLVSGVKNQMILGTFNEETASPFAIGNGTDDENRSNLFEINSSGDVIIAGDIKRTDGTPQGTVYVGEDEPTDINTLIWINPN